MQDLKPVMLVVIAQIRELFGLPPLVLLGEDKRFALVPAVSSGFADWYFTRPYDGLNLQMFTMKVLRLDL
jgi:hypothetical protein